MYFNKIVDPINCSFPARYDAVRRRLGVGAHAFELSVSDLGQDVFRVRLAAPAWPEQYSQAELQLPSGAPSPSRLELGPLGELRLFGAGGDCRLESVPGQSFGVCGQSWLFHFCGSPDARYYGLGEKCVGFERSGLRTKFWNTDVWADFPMSEVRSGTPDPLYANIPWLIIEQQNRYVGLLLNNAGAVFLSTPARGAAPEQRRFWLGAPDGAPELFIIEGPTLAALTEKFQRLVGVTPRPPLWSLGHQQSRWGYKSRAELEGLAAKFARHAIPNDGLWLDIDYMVGFRVFSVDASLWPELPSALEGLARRGHPVVPILDPGVKLEPGYRIYDEGLARHVFCLNPEGEPFVGYVWPGRTVFPDFSLARVRDWWADEVARFASAGFFAAWIDMNDPSTGATENTAMLFDEGRRDHASYHNQYASGMALATRQGFERAWPDQRPFVLTRSAFIGTGRHAAVWTGDNCSNFHHLSKCIEVSVNLALSGIPFNGPDVPGFGDDADPALALAWYKVCFLFPFLRNHCHKDGRPQEPWTFGKRSRVIGKYIRLRYELLPYLYQLFVEQERSGAAILRPIFYDFDSTPELPLGLVHDQFMVGPAILQAPLVDLAEQRTISLPPALWFCARTGAWRKGGRRINVNCPEAETPLYVRAGSLIPMAAARGNGVQTSLNEIELHVFCPPGVAGRLDYTFDDGKSLGYARGEESRVSFELAWHRRQPALRVQTLSRGFGALGVRVVWYGAARELLVESAAGEARRVKMRKASVELVGDKLAVGVSARLEF